MKINNKTIITSLIIFLLASFIYLAYSENKRGNEVYDKDLWIVYFDSPAGDDLSFIIENFSESADFQWEVYADSEKIEGGDTAVERTYKKSIDSTREEYQNKKVTIAVTHSGEKKEIYKIIEPR